MCGTLSWIDLIRGRGLLRYVKPTLNKLHTCICVFQSQGNTVRPWVSQALSIVFVRTLATMEHSGWIM